MPRFSEQRREDARAHERKRPAYELIAGTLRNAILQGLLKEGTILTESALSNLFGASRSPVKQAFSSLEAQELVRRFEGRGVIVGTQTSEPVRITITAELLGIGPDPADAVRGDPWDTLYYGLERDLILTSIFGRFRVNELALARHANVGRTVARNLLLRAQALGLLTKADSSHWYIVPMNEARVRDLYELRVQLETCLAKTAAGHIPTSVLRPIEERLQAAAAHFSMLPEQGLDALETDLHLTCLSYGHNVEMAEALKRTHCTLVVGKHVQAAIAKNPQIDPFVDDHLAIVEALREGRGALAAKALKQHLIDSSAKAIDRLHAFRNQKIVQIADYLVAE